MFKGFQNISRTNGFNGFPALNFQMNNEAYGFSGCTFWLDAAYGLNTQTDLAAVSSWQPRIGPLLTQTTAANQPRYNLSNALYNNLPSVEMHTNTRLMNFYYPLALPSKWTIILVGNYNTLNATTNSILANSTGSAALGLGGGLAGINGAFFYNNNAVAYTGTTESTSVKIAAFTNGRLLVNRTEETTSANPNIWVGSITFLSLSGGSNFLGYVAELLVFNYEMTKIQCENISDRLNSKYAIY